jgi:hypothetical protein
MRNFRLGFVCLLTALLVVFVAGCGQETVTIPSVVSVTPAQGAASVAVNTAITATFSEAMATASITATTFTVAAPNGVAVAGAVTYSGVTATFTPTAALASGTTYTATITTGATTPGGAALMGNYVWSFSTVAAVAPSIPTVSSVTPTPFASNVPLTGAGATITATFSQAMTAASIGATGTFTVEAQGGVAVPGSAVLNSAGTVATFTPTSGTLAYSTNYTVTITTAATSTGGIPLAGNYVWTFTTLAAGVPFVSSVTPTQGLANVAVNASITATFSIPMSPASVNGTTTFKVAAPGGVAVAGSAALNAAGTVATFTLTSGTLAQSTTYTATITTAATSTGGVPIVANYVWSFTTITPPPLVVSTIPLNTATGVPIGQLLTATFNEAMLCSTLQQSPATTFTLAGPGTTSVTGAATCSGNVAIFTPGSPLAYNTVYTATISIAAKDLAGTPMALAYSWKFTTVPAAPLAPTVIATVPTDSSPGVPAVGVPVNQALTATFSEAMDPATINSATFTLVQTSVPGTPINGVITYVPAGSIATFTPNASLLNNTNYTATITAGAEDLNDDAFVTAYTWTFTTAVAPVAVVPTVISTIPVTPSTVAPIVAEDVTVPLNQAISADFSVPMNPSTITAITPPTFTLTYPVAGVPTSVAGLVAYSGTGNQLVFLPTANLLANTTYTATITTAAQSLTGTPLASNYSWIFATAAAVSSTGPELVLSVPGDTAVGVDATGVALNQAISATFSEAMNSLTLTNATYQLYTGNNVVTGTPIQATITYDPINFIATLTPTNPLAPTTYYTAVVTTGATDLAGNPLGSTPTSPYTNPWVFETGAAAVPPPVVLGPTIEPFGGFAGSAGMTNTGILTVINGDSGTTATGYSAYTGFHDNSVLIGGVAECTYTEVPGADIGLVTGTIYSPLVSTSTFCPLEGTAADIAVATEALAEATTAYTTLQGLPGGLDFTTNSLVYGGGGPGELGNSTLAPGIYKSAPGSYGITIGDLTLDAQGDPNAYWVFQMATTLTVGQAAVPRNVKLINGAKATNVYWAVGSDVTHLNMAGGGTFNGTVIANGAVGIAVSTVGNTTITTINGRLISLNASTTLVDTVINVPAP